MTDMELKAAKATDIYDKEHTRKKTKDKTVTIFGHVNNKLHSCTHCYTADP